ncbi:MAG: isocitrate lyase/phosphoenolpyruvate mutase family protein [Kiritimatiellae bacterium]|jgi:phosphoenolpyruvate mutase|nr:isocitrate lyase/phosphoenolpyruvate mutase family protein [Kiritimatiellia bacterium]
MSLKNLISPEQRRKKLKTILLKNGFARIIETHNGLSGLIGNDACINLENGDCLEFDGLWESSFTDSASKGHPDAEIIGPDSRLHSIEEIMNVTNKPMIVDGDTGGEATQFEYFCSKLERFGVSAVIIEDKIFPKRNSLEPGAKQELEDPDVFATKIWRGNKIALSQDFMIIARLESLIANKGIEDAISRARTYLRAGADGIMIHSKEREPRDVFRFAEEYTKLCDELGYRKPLVCVPTAYNRLTEQELVQRGFNIIIHANHLLRASYAAMQKVCKKILISGRSFEADLICAPVRDVFKTVGFMDVKEKDKVYNRMKTCAIIPDTHRLLDTALIEKCGDIPISAVELLDKSIIQRQAEVLNNAKIFNIYLVGGFGLEKITYRQIKKIINPQYDLNSPLHALFCAEEQMQDGFIMIYSDVLFYEKVISEVLQTQEDIVLIIDSTYPSRLDRLHKTRMELVIAKHQANNDHYRMLTPLTDMEIKMIGKRVSPDLATHEFTGIAYFSEQGADILKSVYHEAAQKYAGKKFHEAATFETASFTDIIQELIDLGYPLNVCEVNQGWQEIHNTHDYKHALESLQC